MECGLATRDVDQIAGTRLFKKAVDGNLHFFRRPEIESIRSVVSEANRAAQVAGIRD
jgi:hypothetical protein